MSNLNQKIYFLSLQKFLPFDELISFLNLNKDEIIDLTQRYSREYCEEQEKYFEEIISKKFLLMPEVLNFIFLNANNKKFKLNDILKEFRVEKNYIVNFLYYLVKTKPKLAYILFLNENFHKEIKKEIENAAIDRISTNVKLFRNNKERTAILIEQAKEKSIEELSLIFSCAPFIVEEELLYLARGGFWNNENIRLCYPFFIGSINKKFSKSEILYLINNKFLDRKVLAERVKTSLKNLDEFFSILEGIKLKDEIIIKFILSEEIFLSNEWLRINALLSLEKDNSNYLYNYPFEKLFEKKELKAFEEIKDNFTLKIEGIEKILSHFDGSSYLFVTYSDKKYIANIVYENELFKAIKESKSNQIVLLDNKEILFYKKLKI